MSERQGIQCFLRGTAIKILSKLNVEAVDSATITIDDPSDNEKVSNANMTNDADFVYSYIWQTSTSNADGIYVVTLKMVSGVYTSVRQEQFELLQQEGSE